MLNGGKKKKQNKIGLICLMKLSQKNNIMATIKKEKYRKMIC